jgi:hypothetical protein
MNNFTDFRFSKTTADDQDNYFTGEVQPQYEIQIGESRELSAGNYRVIDGELLPILSGYTISDIKAKFDDIAKHK